MAKTAIFLAEGYEEIEALAVVDIFRRAGIETDMVSISDELLTKGSHSIEVMADKLLKDANFEEYDMLVLPGGLKGMQNLEACEVLMEQIDAFYKNKKYIAAICATAFEIAGGYVLGTLNDITMFVHSIIPVMELLREAVDSMESMVSSNLWPYPTYGDLMFKV